MNRLYVRFAGDNDFFITVKAFVMAIAPKILLGEWENITKEEIVNLFNEHAYSMYALHQSRDIKTKAYIYGGATLQSYLQIETKDVYFDDEIDEFTNFNHDGCMAVLERDDIGYYMM